MNLTKSNLNKTDFQIENLCGHFEWGCTVVRDSFDASYEITNIREQCYQENLMHFFVHTGKATVGIYDILNMKTYYKWSVEIFIGYIRVSQQKKHYRLKYTPFEPLFTSQ